MNLDVAFGMHEVPVIRVRVVVFLSLLCLILSHYSITCVRALPSVRVSGTEQNRKQNNRVGYPFVCLSVNHALIHCFLTSSIWSEVGPLRLRRWPPLEVFLTLWACGRFLPSISSSSCSTQMIRGKEIRAEQSRGKGRHVGLRIAKQRKREIGEKCKERDKEET